ncbi:hypothetical protein A2303_05740 [Candidatus Falkowbacteria bacterium RIFOXYB2_FULL_47_14]|uniref:Methyltransferase type 11 domain-containing protein n=1 Tax=Candidatus Falkowbacteria bacterium RIFOXYA2_FULL_47_19 TaxID=1797994 RepID=A0A1F5SES3_9BACT|nr:MAG: hypothetical protein A2227_07140 [Candidatus Falkowbacteria bacterium RIFOXYA2_FULL_47_19]OGF35346.1 MAG: hypothetical protein A2468_00290 [Candidatus Falkowbacteria bacterium RIFOXYC2_FULL_46_15]OGF43787.1 MAG: hypothetical protein A2303_05740 [Candidatus Falkowbacteria bacterium RIFOXYB2_FULL_47_14]
MEKINLEKIGELSVTDRGLEQVLEDMGIEESEIDKFPKDGMVLNIGSGLYQKFEEELRGKRGDLKIVSIDPTLGMDFKDLASGDWYIEKLGNSIAQYKERGQPKMKWGKDMTVKNPDEFQSKRLKKIKESGSNSVAALAPQLPFGPGSFDIIIDCVASMRYLNDEKSREENLSSICDLLRPGGSAYITSLKKSELKVLSRDFQVKFLREYEGGGIEYCDVKITKEKIQPAKRFGVPDIPRPDGYDDAGWHAYNMRMLKDYKEMIFKDSPEAEHYKWLNKRPEDPSKAYERFGYKKYYHTLEHYLPAKQGGERNKSINFEWDWPEKNLFGGLDGFFEKGAKILDLGSGLGKVTEEINNKYKEKNISCVGLDHRLAYQQPDEKISNLVSGDFGALSFKTDSFNRLLSVESFPAFLPSTLKKIEEYFQEITRVSRIGTIWRGTFSEEEDIENKEVNFDQLKKLFGKYGWELVVSNNSFVALLQNKK